MVIFLLFCSCYDSCFLIEHIVQQCLSNHELHYRLIKAAENREVILFNEENLDTLYSKAKYFAHEKGKNTVKLALDESRKQQIVVKVLQEPASEPDSEEYNNQVKNYIREFTLMR